MSYLAILHPPEIIPQNARLIKRGIWINREDDFFKEQRNKIRRAQVYEYLLDHPDSPAKDIAAYLGREVPEIRNDLIELKRHRKVISNSLRPRAWRAM